MNKIYIVALFLLCLGCESESYDFAERYKCDASGTGSAVDHPLGESLQRLLEENYKSAYVGVSLAIENEDGSWYGSAGKANVELDVDMQPCNKFLIASTSKTFTASLVFLLIEEGKLELDSKIDQFLSAEIVNNVANVDEASIEDLLSHRSGIVDYYTDEFEEQRSSYENNNWQQEDMLAFTYGLAASFKVGEQFEYSNTNYLLLGIILENITGKSLTTLYQQKIFDPLGLTSAYYSTVEPLTSDLVQGYLDGNGNSYYFNSKNLYQDELKTADGGIAINAIDLNKFLRALLNGKLVNETSLNQMKNWFDLPEENQGLFQVKNGLGLEYYENETGVFYGHTGLIDGFQSFMFYYPENDMTVVILMNSVSANFEPILNMYGDLMTILLK